MSLLYLFLFLSVCLSLFHPISVAFSFSSCLLCSLLFLACASSISFCLVSCHAIFYLICSRTRLYIHTYIWVIYICIWFRKSLDIFAFDLARYLYIHIYRYIYYAIYNIYWFCMLATKYRGVFSFALMHYQKSIIYSIVYTYIYIHICLCVCNWPAWERSNLWLYSILYPLKYPAILC